MPLIKIPRNYLIAEDENFITADVPDSLLQLWQKDYQKVIKAKGILKDKKAAMLSHVESLRREWDG
ncbi:MAG: hypothetical protein IM477_10175 [Microcystis sp. M090S1]|uniref:hypothetical protein n=1 Tax=Microcystis sp. M090S1 TaxID=2771135 RepID=UPI001DC7A2D0|nr:hypothetical protein [Microcystis sp. M090S1]MCA2812882.1 hypothetical protein [Microcystis sp. M090S1]NCR54851.1 hypothetical protein [Microcystis aeruginosa L211-07]